MRLKHHVNVFITDDADGADVLFGNSDPATALQQIDAFKRYASGKLNIAASATENLPLGDVDAVKGVYVQLDGDFDVVFNGGSDTINFKKADTLTGRVAKMFMEADFSAIAITNPDGATEINGRFVVWGDT
jgi:hypothetical protein